METREKIEKSIVRERASLALEIPMEAKANTIRVVVLQHPQEPDKELGTAALLVRGLENAELRVGLSWRSLRAVAGESAVPSEWVVLYLGGKGKDFPKEVNFTSTKGDILPVAPQPKGLLVLDGTWSQAKALWWRNSWLTKLKRVVLQPKMPSRYGKLRKEPRHEAVSTLESVALALSVLDPQGPALREHLENGFQRMLEEYKKTKTPQAKP